MEKIFGTEERHDQLIRFGSGRAVLIYGYGEENGHGFDYRHTFDHMPVIEEVRAVVTEHINAQVKERIVQGMTWDDIPVWLDETTQRNYLMKALQVQNGTNVLPVTVKIGTDEDPVFVTFNTADDYMRFFNAVSAHISKEQATGWEEKTGIDWSVFDSVF